MAMANGPKIPQTPLELLENDGTRETPFLSKVWVPVCLGTMGFVAVITANVATKRPIFSGIQRHILASAGLVGIGKLLDDYRNQILADRDAVLRHYIQLHPEDFPPFERKRFQNYWNVGRLFVKLYLQLLVPNIN
ncbi:hypothetical protein NQ317_006204 [Molorchus minor]|uniref:NADH dehydrogenase [ubiquinone] 1 subunit C2 n=1 Tax=Molorchus minor TaxID=1323400 RepID=A0ABQ9ITH2_9CUCU|nr:hypothetical protein NQ317_006204 [Molorchus minor]